MKDNVGNEIHSFELALGSYQNKPCLIISGVVENDKKMIRILRFDDIITVPAEDVMAVQKNDTL